MKNATWALSAIVLTVFSQTASAESYWQKSFECKHPETGHAWIDVDAAARKNVQLVISDKGIVSHLSSVYEDYFTPPLRTYENGQVGVIQATVDRPLFSGNDFQGLETPATYGSGYGAYAGAKATRQGDKLSVDIFRNGYSKCNGEIDSDGQCRGVLENVPYKVFRNWEFKGCRPLN